MPIKENATKLSVIKSDYTAISSNTTTAGPIIDTKDMDLGLFFAIGCVDYTDGTYTLKIEHGDDSGLSDAADVSSSMLVYGSLPALSAVTADGAYMSKEGVHSTKRYVRASIVSTSVTTGATIVTVAIAGKENWSTAQAG